MKLICCECEAWSPNESYHLGQCRRRPPEIGSSGRRGFWPETYGDEGCMEGVPLASTSPVLDTKGGDMIEVAGDAGAGIRLIDLPDF